MMNRNYDPLLHTEDYASFLDMQDDVLEWWYDEYDRYPSIPLWESGCPNSHPEYSQREPSLVILPYKGHQPPKGVILVSAGGGFAYKSHHEGICVAQRFSEDGFVGAVLDYRVLPYTQYDLIDDVKRAVQILRSKAVEYSYPADAVALLGFSAGGQASLLGAVYGEDGNPDSNDPIDHFSSRPNAVVCCYSAISWLSSSFMENMDAILGSANSLQDKLRFSTSEHLSCETPPIFFWCSRQDAVLNPHMTLQYAARMLDYGIPFELHIYDDGEHGIGLCDNTSKAFYPADAHINSWTRLASDWLTRKFIHSTV